MYLSKPPVGKERKKGCNESGFTRIKIERRNKYEFSKKNK